jgi:hypothetical protein
MEIKRFTVESTEGVSMYRQETQTTSTERKSWEVIK